MKTYLTLFFALLLLCTGAGAALASTPDGQTPAEETICDTETGAAYGLCNAYCEAMDCESDNPSASATACSKVRDKFQQITGRDLPCEAPVITCLCQSIPEFNADLAGITTCSHPSPFELIFSNGSGQESFVGFATGTPGCGIGYSNTTNVIDLTDPEYNNCLQVVLNAAASRGVTCN